MDDKEYPVPLLGAHRALAQSLYWVRSLLSSFPSALFLRFVLVGLAFGGIGRKQALPDDNIPSGVPGL